MRSSNTKPKFCAKRSAASGASNGPAKSRRTLRRPGAIATARNGKCARSASRDRSATAPDASLAESTSSASATFARIHGALRGRGLRDSLAAAAEDFLRFATRSRPACFRRTLREIEAFADAGDSKLLLTATFAGFPSRAAELAEKIRRARAGNRKPALLRSRPRAHGAFRPGVHDVRSVLDRRYPRRALFVFPGEPVPGRETGA